MHDVVCTMLLCTPEQFGYGIFGVVWEYVLPLGLFIYFYGHILVVIRRRGKQFMASSNRAANQKQASCDAFVSKLNDQL